MKSSTNKTTSLRPTEDDKALLVALKRKTGASANAELYRMGLRALAEKFGIAAEDKNE